MKRKRMKAAPASWKLVVVFALFLLTSANAFTSLSSVAGKRVRINHLIRSQQPAISSTNQSMRESIETMKKDAELNSSSDSFTNADLILKPPGNFTSETIRSQQSVSLSATESSNPTRTQDCEGEEHSQVAFTSGTSELSNPTQDHDREGEEHSQVACNVVSRTHDKERVNN